MVRIQNFPSPRPVNVPKLLYYLSIAGGRRLCCHYSQVHSDFLKSQCGPGSNDNIIPRDTEQQPHYQMQFSIIHKTDRLAERERESGGINVCVFFKLIFDAYFYILNISFTNLPLFLFICNKI